MSLPGFRIIQMLLFFYCLAMAFLINFWKLLTKMTGRYSGKSLTLHQCPGTLSFDGLLDDIRAQNFLWVLYSMGPFQYVHCDSNKQRNFPI